MINTITCLGLIIYAAISAAEDIKNREISLAVSIIFILIGAVTGALAGREPESLIKALLPGAVILITAFITNGAIGLGDAVFVGTCAFYMNVREIGLCVAAAWGLCALAALIMISLDAITAGSAKRHRRGMPFAAYMFLPVLLAAVQRLI